MTSNYVTVANGGFHDPSGRPLILRGVNLGGWLLMENMVNGHPATESLARKALQAALGDERYGRFSERLLNAFYGDDDASFIASLGLNCVRIPVNYRHFEDDLRPFEFRSEGLLHLDRAIRTNARHGLYSIIDLHAAQGWQNHAWHCDNHTLEPLLWDQRQFQDRVVWLWEQLAEHYRDEPWIAGYNILNEPADASGTVVGPFYRRVVEAIRAVDPNHLLILDGNTYAQEFEGLGDPIVGATYSLHQYPDLGFTGAGPYPGQVEGRMYDRAAMEREFLTRAAYMKRNSLPVLVGEFGPVYDRDPVANEDKLRLLEDQLAIYEQHAASWTIWLYKDVDLQGLVSLPADSPWRRLMDPFIARKRRLAAEFWGVSAADKRANFGPILDLVEREFRGVPWYPFGAARQASTIVGEKLLAELLLPEYGRLFAGLDDHALDQLADSFLFQRCEQRTGLIDRLAGAVGSKVAPAAHVGW
jgi:endoglucanase